MSNNWKYDYESNQNSIEDKVNIWNKNSQKRFSDTARNNMKAASDFKNKYLNFDQIRKDSAFWDQMNNISTADIGIVQKIAFGEEKETHWTDFNIIKKLLEWLQNLIPIKEIISQIMKGVQTVMEILKQVETLIRYFAGFVLSLLSPWIIIARMIVQQIKELLTDILDATFKFNLLGASALLGTFFVEDSPKADVPLVTDSQRLYDIFDEMTTTWKNRPTASRTANAMLFLPVGNIGIVSRPFSKIAKVADDFYKDLKTSLDPEVWDRKLNKFRSGLGKGLKNAYNEVYDTVDTINDLLSLFKTKFFDPSIDQTIKDRDPIGSLEGLQNTMFKLLEEGMDNTKLRANVICDSISKNMVENGIKKFLTPKINSFDVNLSTDNSKIHIELNGPRNNDVIIHKLYFKLRTLDEPLGEELLPIYINPRTLPLEGFKHISSIAKTFNEDFLSVGNLYDKYGTFIKGMQVPVGSDGSIWKTILNLDSDYFNFENENDKYLIFLRETLLTKYPELLSKSYTDSLYGGNNLFDFSGADSLIRPQEIEGNRYTELYKPRYNLNTGNDLRAEVTPWEIDIDLNNITGDALNKVSKALSEITNKVPEGKRTERLYLFAELIPGNGVMFSDDFLDPTIETADIFPAYWNIGNYGAHNEATFISQEISLAKEKPFSLVTGNEWLGYNISGFSIEDILKTYIPEVFDAYDDVRREVFDFLDYLDALLNSFSSVLDSFAALLNQIADIIKYINADWLLNIFKVLKQITFEEVPLIYYAIWDGPSDKLSSLLKQGVIERGIQESIKGGIVIYTQASAIVGILELLNVFGKLGKAITPYEGDKDIPDSTYKPTGPMPPFGFSADPFVAIDISPPKGVYDPNREAQRRVVDGQKREEYPSEDIGRTITSDYADKRPPTTISEAIKAIKDSGVGVGTQQDFHEIAMQISKRINF